MTIKPCPCGGTPKRIDAFVPANGLYAVPSCCKFWGVYFRPPDAGLIGRKTREAALQAWNDAPRGEVKQETSIGVCAGVRRCRIVKMGYSVNPWRLLTADGGEINAKVPIDPDHPERGYYDGSISGRTRKECEEHAMRILQRLFDGDFTRSA